MSRKEEEQVKHERRRNGPGRQGLYDPAREHDSCGVGFVVNVEGRKSHAIVTDALTVLVNLRHSSNHRGSRLSTLKEGRLTATLWSEFRSIKALRRGARQA